MEMNFRSLSFLLAGASLVVGCSTTSSSTVLNSAPASPWTGPVFVSSAQLPGNVQYKVIGSVQADARAGYDKAIALYPFLAAEARKIGANAVMGVTDGRRVTAFSWSAAYVSGIAVRVEDPEKLKGLAGSYH
jgi:uncharacterized protein YbjQ (UPF0145 family)